MFNAKGFFDLGVSERCIQNDKYVSTIQLLYGFGYRTIAINQELNLNENPNAFNKKKKKGEPRDNDLVPEPIKCPPVLGCEDMKILNRLTIEFAHQDALHKVTKSTNYKKYNIIAALPTTTTAALFVSNTFEAEIYCFNPMNKNAVRSSRKMFNQLIERGFHFEIPYCPIIEDSTMRRNVIHTSHVYHSYAKSKNIIISSLATHTFSIRSPYDVINLGFVFGLNEQQAKNAVINNGRQVFINSVGRRHGKAVMFVETIEKIEPMEESVILVESDNDDDIMEVDQPALKKIKQ